MTTSTDKPIFVIMPILNNLAQSLDAISDCLTQSVPTRVLVINQGSETPVREALEREAELRSDRLFIWSHNPPLPSLSASWNLALDFVWANGGDRAWVINNDTRVLPQTLEALCYVMDKTSGLFVTAVAVTPEQYEATVLDQVAAAEGPKGGPDFSCFLISRESHRLLRFDEGYIPAYGEDCCYHREMMLMGEGSRIFSANLPYLHFASGTIKAIVDPEKRAAFERKLGASRRYHEVIWGGPINQERFSRKGDPTSAMDGVSTPELQKRVQAGEVVGAHQG